MNKYIKKWVFSIFKDEFALQEEWIKSSLIHQQKENSDTEARMDVLEKQFLELFRTWQKPKKTPRKKN